MSSRERDHEVQPDVLELGIWEASHRRWLEAIGKPGLVAMPPPMVALQQGLQVCRLEWPETFSFKHIDGEGAFDLRKDSPALLKKWVKERCAKLAREHLAERLAVRWHHLRRLEYFSCRLRR